jgi:hypothetical protein
MSSTEIDRAPAPPAVVPSASLAMQEDKLAMLWREAKALAAGGMFKDVTQAEQAFAKMVIGDHLGLTPAQSMTGIDIVKGNPQLRGTLMGTMVRAHAGYDWKVLTMGPAECSIEFFREGESQGISTWSAEDSKRAKLDEKTRGGEESNHVKYPTAMFWNRAMSQGVKLLVPEVMGGIPVYTPEDLEGLPEEGARDGEPGGRSERAPATEMAAVEVAIRTHLPTPELVKSAEERIHEMNRLAPNSWTPSKVEMVFKGKTAYAASAEIAHIERAIEELRARPSEEPEEAEVVEDAEQEQPEGSATPPEPEESPAEEPSAEVVQQLDVLRSRETELEERYAQAASIPPGDGEEREAEELGIELEHVRTAIRDLGFTPAADEVEGADQGALPL